MLLATGAEPFSKKLAHVQQTQIQTTRKRKTEIGAHIVPRCIDIMKKTAPNYSLRAVFLSKKVTGVQFIMGMQPVVGLR